MTSNDDRRFPAPLAAAMAVPFTYDDGRGVDFEPFPAFLSADETSDWLRAWTGNPDLDGAEFRVFGQAATAYEPDRAPRPSPELTAIAERFAPEQRTSASTVIEQARRGGARGLNEG